MSYDITLVRRRPGQTWEDALEAAEQHEGEPLGPEQLARWPRIERRITEILGGDTESVAEDSMVELAHKRTGLQVYLFAAEAGVSYPYWEQEDPERFHQQVAAVVAVLEEETGLSAYDPQTGETFDGTPADENGIAFVGTLRVQHTVADAGIPWPGAPSLPVGPETVVREGAVPPPALVDRRPQRRALRYLVTGVVVLAFAVPLLVINPQPSPFAYLAVAIGVLDTVVGLVLWWRARR